MSARFTELAWCETPMGEISLRRRVEPQLKVDVYEVKLGDEFLMSSLFTVAEVALARLALAELSGTGPDATTPHSTGPDATTPAATTPQGTEPEATTPGGTRPHGTRPGGTGLDGIGLDVVVGGLGLGYTARAALEDDRVRSLAVVEALAEVVAWHERGLLPDAAALTGDPRTRLVVGDFFAMVRGSFEVGTPGPFHAVLLDIDHTPRHVLHPSHSAFYTVEGLRALTRHLHPGGVFALWSDDPPDAELRAALAEVFATEAAHVVAFPNFYTGGESTATIYVARTAASAGSPAR